MAPPFAVRFLVTPPLVEEPLLRGRSLALDCLPGFLRAAFGEAFFFALAFSFFLARRAGRPDESLELSSLSAQQGARVRGCGLGGG